MVRGDIQLLQTRPSSVRSNDDSATGDDLNFSRRTQMSVMKTAETPYTFGNRRSTSTMGQWAQVAVAALLASTIPMASAQACISLANSTQCPAFNASSISTGSSLTGLLYVRRGTKLFEAMADMSSPFLAFVSSTEDFDMRLSDYIATSYVQLKYVLPRTRSRSIGEHQRLTLSRYQQLLGCTNVTLLNTTGFYARYTTSVICNAIVQNSITPCHSTAAMARPLCADTCVSYPRWIGMDRHGSTEISADVLAGTIGHQ